VPQDQNGTLVKLYDARAGGGFAFAPAPPPCKASDECHGAGTQEPAAPSINSLAGSTGNYARPSKQGKCKRGFVRSSSGSHSRKRNGNRHKRCVRRRDHRKRHNHRHGKGKRDHERQGGRR
jgi:hypothetical protein